MRRALALSLIVAAIALGVVADYFAHGAAAAVQSVFYVAMLGFVIGLLRIVIPRR